MNRKRYAVVGTGARVEMFLDAIAGKYQATTELVGLCDLSAARMAYHNARLKDKFGSAPITTYAAADFDRMIASAKPDIVIVTTIDAMHHHYVVRAMELGCDVLCEKPLTTDAAKARAIFDAIQRTGRRVRVTFNVRYIAYAMKVREIIQSGAIGKPLSADLQWMLDTRHGADYFRRWHAEKDMSGGLLIHKASHHFDMMNWWLGSYPQTVFAMGDLKFYGEAAARARGHVSTYSRSRNAPEGDPFRHNWTPEQEGLYGTASEAETGYVRDRNVFGPHVTIEDTMAITARYRNGVIFCYSLVAYSPWEGFRAAVTGTKGRVELFTRHGAHVLPGNGIDADTASALNTAEDTQLTLYPMFGVPQPIVIPKVEGPHGGGDAVMLDDLFSGAPTSDPLGRVATHIDGAASILLGIAANESIATGRAIEVDELLSLPR